MLESGPSLFDRIGGDETVTTLVDDFYERIFSDPELGLFFAHSPKDKLVQMQREFFAVALDGPSSYTGRSLNEVHFGRGITAKHLGLYIDHLTATLQDFGLDEEAKRHGELESAQHEPIERCCIVVDNAHLGGIPFGCMPGIEETGVRISRIKGVDDDIVHVATDETELHEGDVVQVIGTRSGLERFAPLIGQF